VLICAMSNVFVVYEKNVDIKLRAYDTFVKYIFIKSMVHHEDVQVTLSSVTRCTRYHQAYSTEVIYLVPKTIQA
jgi:hypothetical protein